MCIKILKAATWAAGMIFAIMIASMAVITWDQLIETLR